MYASRSSPPPQDLDVGLLVPTPAFPSAVSGTVTGNNSPRSSVPPTTTAQGRKRKRGQAASTSHAASPAPSDTGNNTNGSATGNDSLLASRADLYSRPMLTIMRGPLFIPTTSESSSEFYRTEGTGVNRVGFRYVPAGINPPGTITPCRTIESAPTSFRVSWEDRSPHIRVSKDGLGLQGFRGFRSARCNAPVREGKWYLEVKIVNGGGDRFDNVEGSSKAKEGNHVRIGWGRREATLNGPVGLDGYSYAIRDKTGEKVTLSRARPYASKGFKSGDVVGMYISLPPLRQPAKKDPHDPAHIHRERIPIDLKGQEYFEILEYPTSKEMLSLMDYSGKTTNTASVPSAVNTKKPAAGAKPPERPPAAEETKTKKALNEPPLRPLPTLPGSRIAFFINGEPQGIAFQDIYDFLPLRQTADEQKRKAKDRTRRAREGVKEHRENPFDDGTLGYYPMISLFNDAVVKLNPGPNFEFPPPRDIDAVLEGRPQPEVEVVPPASTTIEDATMNVCSNVPVKAEPEPVSLDVPMDLDTNTVGETKPPPAPTQIWRPVADRYPEFMQEQWKLDQIEEDEAKIEYERQAAKASGAAAKGGAGKKGGAGGKAGSAAKGKVAAGGGTKKKGSAGAEAETPEMATPAPEGAPNAPAKKRAKKATAAAAATAGQLSGPGIPGTVPSSSGAATPALSEIIPRSATETPFGTPPPPSVSSTAAAAAAAFAHLHQVQVQSGGVTGSGGGYAQQQQQLQGPGQAYHQVQNPQLQSQQQQYSGDPRQYHHALVRSESNSNRPSPSPLRQSTAYRDERTGMGGYDDYDLPAVHAHSTPIPVTVAPPSPSTSMAAAGDPELGVYPGQGDEDDGQDEEVFATSNHGSAISQAQVRHKKPPGSQRGRVHAQQAALAAAGLVQPQPLHPLQQQLQHSQLQQHDSYSLLDSRDPGQSAQAIARMGAHQATAARGQRDYEDNEGDQDDDEEQEGVEDNDDQEVGRPRSEYDSSNGGGGTPGDYEMGEDEQSEKGDGDEDSTPGEFDREERDGEDDEDGGEGGGGATTDDEERDGDVDMGGESRRDHRHDDGP